MVHSPMDPAELEALVADPPAKSPSQKRKKYEQETSTSSMPLKYV